MNQYLCKINYASLLLPSTYTISGMDTYALGTTFSSFVNLHPSLVLLLSPFSIRSMVRAIGMCITKGYVHRVQDGASIYLCVCVSVFVCSFWTTKRTPCLLVCVTSNKRTAPLSSHPSIHPPSQTNPSRGTPPLHPLANNNTSHRQGTTSGKRIRAVGANSIRDKMKKEFRGRASWLASSLVS